MYRHLFVPLDGSDLATETVGRAVEFARYLGARITFFHAQPDHAAMLLGDAEVVRAAYPEQFAYAFEGRTREILATRLAVHPENPRSDVPSQPRRVGLRRGHPRHPADDDRRRPSNACGICR